MVEVCQGTTKKGMRCKNKARFGHFCDSHRFTFNQAERSRIESEFETSELAQNLDQKIKSAENLCTPIISSDKEPYRKIIHYQDYLSTLKGIRDSHCYLNVLQNLNSGDTQTIREVQERIEKYETETECWAPDSYEEAKERKNPLIRLLKFVALIVFLTAVGVLYFSNKPLSSSNGESSRNQKTAEDCMSEVERAVRAEGNDLVAGYKSGEEALKRCMSE